MQSRRADGRHAWLRVTAESLLAVVLVAGGWTHGVVFVEGGSMRPALHPGDVLLYRRIGATPAAGDLVVFDHAGALVVHRVAGVLRGGGLRTRGDANRAPDAEPVKADDVRGEVVLVVPAGRLAAGVVGEGH